ncbi:MAG TPA: hypothetical protein VMW69_16840 [Spirochaetia bacterium]|nr:hypothetical protein [Spirochaetia bacterium]
MKRLVVVALLLVSLADFVSALVVSNPNDPIYTQLDLWQGRGLISHLPPLRPYPIQLIRTLLEEVDRTGTPADRWTAQSYLKQMTGFLNAHPELTHRSQTDFNHYYSRSGLNLNVNGTLGKLTTMSLRASLLLVTEPYGSLFPAYTRDSRDILSDWSDLPLLGIDFHVRQSYFGGIAVGNDRTYFQAGLMRSSYGPFFEDGAVLSPFAPEGGHMSFTWREKSFTYTMLFDELVATDSTGAGVFPGKYLALHSVDVYPTSWLTLGAIETVIWGGRFEPLYLLPLTEYYYSQGILGFPDNSMLGLSGSIRLPYSLEADGLLYIDDINFDQLVTFHFNTKYKVALQAGLKWTPSDLGLLSRVKLGYLMVTPYTYTHEQFTALTNPNWQNYTNQGQLLGSSLPPDSDRLSLEVLTRPLPALQVSLFARMIRHGNASEGIAGGGNGSIYDTGFVNGVPTFQNETRFLTQADIERTYQAGVSADYTFDTGFGTFNGTGSYTYQYVKNANLVPTDTSNGFLSVGLRFAF